MNNLLFAIIVIGQLFFSQKLFAKNQKAKGHIDLGVSVEPGFLFRDLMFKNQAISLSYSAGLLVRFRNLKAFGFTTGLRFSNIRDLSTKTPYDYWQRDLSSPKSLSPLDSLIIFTQRDDKYRLLDVPLVLNWNVKEDRNSISINLGLNCSYFVSEDISFRAFRSTGLTTIESRNITSSKYGILQFAPFASIGFEHRCSDEFRFRIEPALRYQFLEHKFGAWDHFWQFGVNLSLFMAIN